MIPSVHAISAKPDDTATRENVLEVLRKYDSDAYHIMTAETGGDFMSWFQMLGNSISIIFGIDEAVHETYHGYTGPQVDRQADGFHFIEKIYLGDGKSYDVDCSVAYNGGIFTKTEEMSKQIPSRLQTFRYNQYVAPGAAPTANKYGVFGLLNEFTAYYWGLETMNSLAQFLIDTDAGRGPWTTYASMIGNDMTAYAEFKYWTLRYMLYIKSANPSLYQTILDNQNYCAAYRDADALFVSEIARSREIIDNSAQYTRSKGFSVEWSDSEIYVPADFSSFMGSGSFNFWGDDDFNSWAEDFLNPFGSDNSGSIEDIISSNGLSFDLADYNTLMAELRTAEYLEMDAILKDAASKTAETPVTSPTTPSSPTSPTSPSSPHAALSPQKLTVNGAEVNCEKYNIDGSNYFKLRDLAFVLNATDSQFGVGFDAATSTVSITTGQAYESTGTELATGVDNSKTAQLNSQAILINGERHEGLTVYNIGGSNFFQLRELGNILGFEVDFDTDSNTAIVRSVQK